MVSGYKVIQVLNLSKRAWQYLKWSWVWKGLLYHHFYGDIKSLGIRNLISRDNEGSLEVGGVV